MLTIDSSINNSEKNLKFNNKFNNYQFLKKTKCNKKLSNSSIYSSLDILNKPIRICYIGAGYVGGTSSSVMAYKCPQDSVIITVCDVDSSKINSWNSENLPIYEPGLDEIVKKQRGKNLFFTTDIKMAISSSDIIFISVGTPVKQRGIGSGSAAELKFVDEVARKIAQFSESSKIIVEKSTVPCRTADHIRTILNSNKNAKIKIVNEEVKINKNSQFTLSRSSSNSTLNEIELNHHEELLESNIHFEILSNPEFLSEGTAVYDILYPDRVLIGGLQTEEGIEAQNILYRLYSYWIPKEKIIKIGLWSSELTKLAANALLAQRISSINSLSVLCEEIGADIQEVSYACGMDSRIGSKFLKPSVGFGGSCFKKDIMNLVYISNTFNLSEVAEYWKQVVLMNEYRKTKFIKNIFNKLFYSINGKEISIYGFSFKKDTKDTREAASITIVLTLLQEGAIVKLYDPKVKRNQIIEDIKENSEVNEFEVYKKNIKVFSSAYDVAENSDAIVICTEWDEFIDLDYRRIYNSMKKPAFIFDGRLILNHNILKKIGFIVEAIGKKI